MDKIRLLVADEVISMLDASTRIDVLNLLDDAAEESRTTDALRNPAPTTRRS